MTRPLSRARVPEVWDEPDAEPYVAYGELWTAAPAVVAYVVVDATPVDLLAESDATPVDR